VTDDDDARLARARALITAGDGAALGALIADAGAALPALFARLVCDGVYDRLIAIVDEPARRMLGAARPTWDVDALNAPALERLRDDPGHAEYALIVVPGYTPADAAAPVKLSACAEARLGLALAELEAYVAPFVLLSGGAVHPPGTPFNEAIEMRAQLIANGISEERLLIDPFARHSTTNLRNAGRLMLQLGLARAEVVTGFDRPLFDQAFYFGAPHLSTFVERCRSELGYEVGSLAAVDEHRVAFVPSADVARVDWRDPLDY
jgi:hypothetical protein